MKCKIQCELINIDKRKTMIQPMLQQLTVLEEASVELEQSNDLKSDSDAPIKEIKTLTIAE